MEDEGEKYGDERKKILVYPFWIVHRNSFDVVGSLLDTFLLLISQ